MSEVTLCPGCALLKLLSSTASALPCGLPSALSRGMDRTDSLPLLLSAKYTLLVVQSAAAHKARARSKRLAYLCADLQNAGPLGNCRMLSRRPRPSLPPPLTNLQAGVTGTRGGLAGLQTRLLGLLRQPYRTRPGARRADRASRMRASRRGKDSCTGGVPRRHSGTRDSKHGQPWRGSR